MKLKRMAVVAAAAVVGPTVLMATPAMADEAKNTAVTTPDSAPKEDAAPAAETPDAKSADAAKPAVETPAPAAKPAAENPAPAPAKPAPAPVDEDVLNATGPVLGLGGVPASFKAGGDWTNLTVKVDNSKGKAQESYVLVLAVADEANKLSAKDVHVQLYYQGSWHDVEVISDEGTPVALLTDDIEIPAKNLSLQVRVKFNAGAPKGDIAIAVAGGSNVDEDVFSDTAWAESKIVSGSTNGGGNTGGNTGNTGGNHNGGGNTGGGNDTKPNGGGTTTPIVDHNTGSGTGTGTTAGGELAETGADAATSWALGAGGVALAMGAALVAGTGRRRRVTS
ncbi:LPXTG cell wall anchor domain-containing protein [Streptomyces sp. NPDC029216]|uniref:LPXTG cell wall anchor domain-containing protein n=1 Tax=Streptomyces sp. NPDC029216 TaxID=3154701 RepID=UPI0033FBF7EB